MAKKEFYYPAADGVGRIHAVEWTPEGKPVCILQIVHGMAEYVDRYDRFANELNRQGILVAGNDHSGHGGSVREGQPYGYFYAEDAVGKVLADVDALRKRIEEEYPGVPYVILGHSMGSFILRNYLCERAEGLAGAIIMGTGMQPAGLLKVSRRLVAVLTRLQGDKHKSALVNALAFGSYNKRIKAPASAMDWLSTDAAEVAKYNADPLCGFTFTLNGFATLFELISRLHDTDRLEGMPKELPVLFLSGKEDPVGDYGAAVRSVYESFLALGMKEVSLKLYENDRHELINESDRELVWHDISEWLFKRQRVGRQD